jgi:pilus assembly protein TadC
VSGIKNILDYLFKYGTPIYTAKRLCKRAREIEKEFPDLDDILIYGVYTDGKSIMKNIYGIELEDFSYKRFLKNVLNEKRNAFSRFGIYGTDILRTTLLCLGIGGIISQDYFFPFLGLMAYGISLKTFEFTEQLQDKIKEIAIYSEKICRNKQSKWL